MPSAWDALYRDLSWHLFTKLVSGRYSRLVGLQLLRSGAPESFATILTAARVDKQGRLPPLR